MDLFERLPAEILHQVLCDLPNLPSLHALHHASPSVFAYLHAKGSKLPFIVEAIIARSRDNNNEQRGLLSGTRYLTRALVYLWWQLEGSATDNPFPDSYQGILKQFKDQLYHIPTEPYEYGIAPLSDAVPYHIVCKLLAFSVHLKQIAYICFHEALSRCLALRPERLQDPRASYEIPHDSIVQPGKRPPGEAFVPLDIGPPSWIEEQQLILGVLRVFFFFELRQGVRLGKLLQSDFQGMWPQGIQLAEFWNKDILPGVLSVETEGFKTVLVLLNRIVPRLDDIEAWLYSSKLRNKINWSLQSRPWKPDCLAFRIIAMHSDNPGATLAHAMRNRPNCPIRCFDIDYFRVFGLTIWDSTRMIALSVGLTDHPMRCAYNQHVWYIWSSILTQGQWTEIQKKQSQLAISTMNSG